MKQDVLAQKQAQVDEIAKQLTGAKSVIVVDYLGLTVEQATEMRAELREQNATMQVVKNTILRRAAEKLVLKV